MKRQTRRSISVRGTTYEHVHAHCQANRLAVSAFIEERLGEFFSALKRPVPSVPVRLVVKLSGPAPIVLRRTEAPPVRPYRSGPEMVYGPVRLDSAPGMGVKAEPRPKPTPANVAKRSGGPTVL
jgi:hypothetical protein